MQDEILTKEEFDDLIADAMRGPEWHEEFKVRHEANKRAHLEKLAGPLLPELLASRESAERLLCDPVAKKRRAALTALLDHWLPNPQLAQECEKLAFSDNDAEVRGLALSGLSSCYSRTKDARILALLANIVTDNRQPDDFRNSAYFGLFFVDDSDARSLPDPDFRFPDDVDWSFVARFANEKGGPPVGSPPHRDPQVAT